MYTWLTAWRNPPDTGWLAESPVHAQQQVLRRLEPLKRRLLYRAAGLADAPMGVASASKLWLDGHADAVQVRGEASLLDQPERR